MDFIFKALTAFRPPTTEANTHKELAQPTAPTAKSLRADASSVILENSFMLIISLVDHAETATLLHRTDCAISAAGTAQLVWDSLTSVLHVLQDSTYLSTATFA